MFLILPATHPRREWDVLASGRNVQPQTVWNGTLVRVKSRSLCERRCECEGDFALLLTRVVFSLAVIDTIFSAFEAIRSPGDRCRRSHRQRVAYYWSYCGALPNRRLCAEVPAPFGATAPTVPPLASKDPKLSAPLLALLRAVPQRSTGAAGAQQNAQSPVFSTAKLPKPILDNIRAGRMRVNNSAEVEVDIQTVDVTETNVRALRDLGAKVQLVGEPHPNKAKGEVLTAVPTIEGFLAVDAIESVKDLSFVRYIRLPDYAVHNTGSVDTQGDSILQAEASRSMLGVDGTGVAVGVLSDGIGGIFVTGCATACGPTSANPSPISLGDLPAMDANGNSTTGMRNNGSLVAASGGIIAQSFNSPPNLEACFVPCDTTSGMGSEGTAMLEIVHDLAPKAQLYFSNGETPMQFEQAADYLASRADVVVTDISFTSTPPFDGTSSVSVNSADALNNDGNPVRAFVVAAGNFAQDHYEGTYVDSGIDGTALTECSLATCISFKVLLTTPCHFRA